MPFARNLVFNILFVMTTVILSLAATPGLLMPYGAVVWFKQLWLRIVLAMTRAVIGIDWEERGREKIQSLSL